MEKTRVQLTKRYQGDHPVLAKNSTTCAAWKIDVNSAFFPTETGKSIEILASQAVSEQSGAIFMIFMLLEQPGAAKRNCIKTSCLTLYYAYLNTVNSENHFPNCN